MTDKERLEEIKNIYEDYKGLQKKRDFKQADIALLYLSENHIDWLIQQAEKVEYWRKQHRKRCNELEDAYSKIQLIENQLHQAQVKVERYEKVLEFYADEENYKENLISKGEYDADGICISNDEYAPPIIYFDSGEKARKALKGEMK